MRFMLTWHRRLTPSLAAIGVLALGGLGAAPSVAHAASFKVVLLVPSDDARLERSRLDRAYLGHVGGPAQDGLQAALKDAKLELDAAGAAVTVEVAPVATPAQAAEAARRAEQGGAVAVVTDLPAAAMLAAADATKLPLLNLAAPDDALRQEQCRARVLHLLPSERMRADAMAQTLVARRWGSVLLLAGPSASDAARSAAAQAAIKRYGLKLAASKPFKLSADPRERALANPLLLTQGSHDVVWVIDSDGEFARTLPYQTATPRPVVGDAGLVALAWHAQYDRYGAPQISRRFARTHARPMVAADWVSYVAGKALAAAAVAAPKGPAAAFARALQTTEIDASKGVAMSFRAWDGQLRQPMLLSDGQGVVSTAPVEGVLHPKNTLDTLGADAPEALCKVAR
jgi:ABC transporter substrate binding protein (PQQ-dependent alcohol dehydrogenase system)